MANLITPTSKTVLINIYALRWLNISLAVWQLFLLKSSNQITHGNDKTTASFNELCQISNKNINKVYSN